MSTVRSLAIVMGAVTSAHRALKDLEAELRAGDYDAAITSLVDVERELFAIEAELVGVGTTTATRSEHTER